MKKLIRVGMIGFVGMIVLAGAYRYRLGCLQQDLAKRILRFHVIANSNTQEDQRLKLRIRDEIGSFLGRELEGVSGLEECEQIVNGRLEQIEHCAREVIVRDGYDYSVKAAVENVNFPKKTYGSYTFPQGEYRALRVVIGDGAGENWWCVMYPNLCFANSMYEVVDEDSQKELRAVLTQDEYAEIMAEGEIRVRLKYLDNFLKLVE